MTEVIIVTACCNSKESIDPYNMTESMERLDLLHSNKGYFHLKCCREKNLRP